MKYISTRGGLQVSAGTAILKGLADDGGLYVPSSFPILTKDDFDKLIPMDYPERAAEILSLFLDDYTKEELKEYAIKAYDKFEGDPAPVLKIDESMFVLELFHGPTYAFKDLALSILPYLMCAARKKAGETKKTLILVATSGDTGKAAAEGFKDVEGTEIVVLYPSEGVSKLQKLQMTTTEGENVHFVGLEGNFDQAQSLVKKIFSDKKAIERFAKLGFSLSSANSINWGRIVSQIVYYISAYLDILGCEEIKPNEKINFVVPTGNFGNILSAYYAKKMGIPINKLIVASNSNDVLTQFFKEGIYNSKRTFYKTMSPSMDILVSSNLERLLFELSGRDSNFINKIMKDLKDKGEYIIDYELIKKMIPEFIAYMSDEENTAEGIKIFYEMYDYLIDPHTSVATNAYSDYIYEKKDKTSSVIVSTASAYKFAPDVYKCLTGRVEEDALNALKKLHDYTMTEIPESLMELDLLPILHDKVASISDAEEAIFEIFEKKQ